MAKLAKFLQGVAGAGGGAGLNVEDVFSTYLLPNGTSSTQTFVNGIDLANEGGMVWLKSRTSAIIPNHYISDSERVITQSLNSNNTLGQGSVGSSLIKAFNSDGFDAYTFDEPYVTWTFRKAPKFFDVVTYTGNGATQDISHNLGSNVGMLIIKSTSAGNWFVWHRSLGDDAYLFLNGTNAEQNPGFDWIDVTSTTISLQNNSSNTNGQTYVAYLFAHNEGDGGFGPTGDQDNIKCGSYTGNGSTNGPEIDLGFEPQWLMFKRADGTGSWRMVDSMRGIATGGDDRNLLANEALAEDDTLYQNVSPVVDLQATGFKITTTRGDWNASGSTYIYIAIRRGTKVPESATEVFEVATRTAGLPSFEAPFTVDMGLVRKGITASGGVYNAARLTGTKFLYTNATDAEANDNGFVWDFMDGWANDGGTSSTVISWMWKRAPGYFDAVAFSGDGVAGRTVSHNLGVAPEMMWVKSRTEVKNWIVYHKDLTDNTKYLELNDTDAEKTATTAWNSTSPTETVFTVGTATSVNNSSQDYIAYLFASLPGISKVGSVSHTSGSATNVDCGFTSGARFILLKVTDSSGSWFVYDTTRGIVAGSDARLKLDSTAAENTGNDDIDPLSSGFTITSTVSTGSYIFYAIA